MKAFLLVLLHAALQAQLSYSIRPTGDRSLLRKTPEGKKAKGSKEHTKVSTNTDTTNTTDTNFSYVGTAVCASKVTKETGQLAFVAYVKTGGDYVEGDNPSIIDLVSDAMTTSMMNVLTRESFAPLDISIEHSLGFQVQIIALDESPVIVVDQGILSLKFGKTSFGLEMSFECCVAETIESDIFKLVVSLLVGEKGNLADLFAQNLNDPLIRIDWV